MGEFLPRKGPPAWNLSADDAQTFTPHWGTPSWGADSARFRSRAMGSKHALHTDRYAAFLDRLRAARRDRDMTQEEVADVLGKPQTYVSKCELGERRVDFVELEDFAAAYGLPLDYFVTRSAGSRRASSTTRRSPTQRKR